MHYLGVVLYQRARFIEALPLLERIGGAAFQRSRSSTTTWASVFAALDRNDEAIAAYRARSR